MQIIVPNGDEAGLILDGEPSELVEYTKLMLDAYGNKTAKMSNDTYDFFKGLFDTNDK